MTGSEPVLVTSGTLRGWPLPAPGSDKESRGRVLVLGGSRETPGAVVLAGEGYPESPRTGDPISGLAEADALDGVTVFAAGVAEDDQGRLVTAGGRVLAVTGMGPSLADARELAYRAADLIDWQGKQNRTDIAAAAAQTERTAP